MTPTELAGLYAAAFPGARGWSDDEFSSLLASPHCYLVSSQQSFALGRVIADEAELLTIATHPDHQGQGLGGQCLRGFEQEAIQRGATRAFLEVASDNPAAIHLYESQGWQRAGVRKGYYTRKAGPAVDALLLDKTLT